MKDKSDKPTGKYLNVKSFYTVLILLALTLALITKFISDNKFERLSVEDDYSYTDFSFTFPIITEPPVTADVNEQVTGVADTRPPVTENTKVAETVPTTLFNACVPYKGSFALPVGDTVCKGYSNSAPVYSATMKDWRVHNAIDFAAVKGDRVCAISPGKVTSVYSDELYGTVAVVDHGNGMLAFYCGLAQEGCAEVGDIVQASDTIGYIDTVPCESADNEEHLHFEITVNGEKVNPLAVIGKEG